MNKDAFQKDRLSRHFAAQGYYVQPEVIVFFKGGIQEKRREITDIDVLGLRPGPDLRWELVLGDCKTLKNQSPANRVIWLSGLMKMFSAKAGVIILQRQYRMDEDHKLLASSLGITLLEENEFEKFDQALVFPAGSSNYPLAICDILELRNLPQRFKPLGQFCDYLYNNAWNEAKHLDIVRKVLGEILAVSRELDPNKTEHLALVLDAAGVFSVGIAELVGIVFNQYIQPQNMELLDDALKVLLWDGRSNYEFISKLRSDLLETKKIPPSPLVLPLWDQFLHLVRTMLDNPRLAFSVPQVLRIAALDTLKGTNNLQNLTQDNLLLLKFAMLTVSYFCKASRLPPQFREQLESKFIKLQSSIVHGVKAQESTENQEIPSKQSAMDENEKPSEQQGNTTPRLFDLDQ